MDLHRLLNLWDFAEEEIDAGTSWRPRLRYHPEHPDLNVVLGDEDEVHAIVALRVVDIIDNLVARGASPFEEQR